MRVSGKPVSEHVFPPAFEHLLSASHHAAERAWSAFANFLLAQSVLALAWVTIVEVWYETRAPEFTAVLVAISFAGVVMACQSAMLCTRMWHYHLLYGGRLRELWREFTPAQQGPGANAWEVVEDNVDAYWRDRTDTRFFRYTRFFRLMSANQWLLLLVPIMFLVINAVMLGVVVWIFGIYWTIATSLISLLAIIAVVKVCWSVLK
jgi:hypothetical protein